MAHFAQLDENNVVTSVEVIVNSVVGEPGISFPDTEPVGLVFLRGIHNEPNSVWKQTSYNNSFRKQYAGIGYTYDQVNDVFIIPQPFPSWSLDENFDWQPPVPRPEEGFWTWDEENQEWVELPTE
jgi:hypothetical protein